jgi:peptide/nickel transport system substrate-binding protein
VARELQRRAYAVGVYVPLGQVTAPTAYRKTLSGVIPAPVPFFWNIAKE